MIIKFFIWLHSSVTLAFIISFFGLGGIVLLIVSYNFPEAIPILSNNPDYRNALIMFIASLFLFCLVIDSIGRMLISFVDSRSSTEKAKQEAAYQLNHEKNQIIAQILDEKDKQKKKALEQQASALRQEYESIMSENLRRRDGTFVTDWRESLLVARKRLFDEGQNLLEGNFRTRRMGVLMALAGILVPVSYIFLGEGVNKDISFGAFVASYWPFFTIIFITEIVAIFYLRLYTQTLGRIERNKNEITNIELRLTSGLMLIDKADNKNLKSLADDLAKEERNFVLAKNESSAGIGVDRVVEIITKVIKGGI